MSSQSKVPTVGPQCPLVCHVKGVAKGIVKQTKIFVLNKPCHDVFGHHAAVCRFCSVRKGSTSVRVMPAFLPPWHVLVALSRQYVRIRDLPLAGPLPIIAEWLNGHNDAWHAPRTHSGNTNTHQAHNQHEFGWDSHCK